MTTLTAGSRWRRRFDRRRRLRPTRTGVVVIVLTFAVGFAAFNTGSNLLFFGWGLLLSSIIVSGILSESTLRSIHVIARAPPELRARAPGVLPFLVENRRTLPAFAVEIRARFAQQPQSVPQPALQASAFELRLEPGARKPAELAFVPARRGPLVVDGAGAHTAFPFGFFTKEKRIDFEPALSMLVYPARVDVDASLRDLLSRLGDAPARRAGPGDDMFSLRPFRAGDDPRRIAWRRSARTGRLVVRETEASRSHDVVLALPAVPGADADALASFERAVEMCGSLAEDLLAAQHATGLVVAGASIAPALGPRQRGALLASLAVADAADTRALPGVPARRAVVVAVVARGATVPSFADVVVRAP